MPPSAKQQIDVVTRSFEAVVDDVKEGERSVVAKISTDRVDRYRTSFLAGGVDLRAYRENPVVLWEHGNDPARGTMPIGRNQWIKPLGDGRGLIAKTIFRNDDYADMLFKAYQDGGLRGWSIRALNPEHSPPTKEEIRARPELTDCDTVFRKWELGEYSATALPGNQDTLTILASRGIWMPEEAKAAAVEVDRFIKKKGDKWAVYSESGKELGEHESEEGAKKQLAAIEANKHRTAPYITVNTDGWHVYANERSTGPFKDEATAQECLQLMQGGPSFQTHIVGLIGEVAAIRAEMQRDVEEYIALYRHGRV